MNSKNPLAKGFMITCTRRKQDFGENTVGKKARR
jgi:hypothetical protein